MNTRMKRIAGFTTLLGLMLLAGWYFTSYREAAQAQANVSERVSSSPGTRSVPVVVTPVQTRLFEERVAVQGTLESGESATVASRTDGVIEALYVDLGDEVVAGETKLFKVDDLTLAKALDVSRQDLKMAQFGLLEKKALLEKVEAELLKARLDLRRAEELYENNNISINELEQQQSRYKQSQASRKHAQSLVDLAREQEEQARAALQIAEKNLSDATVYAPINGHVSEKIKEQGEMVSPGKAVLRIENASEIEVAAYLPAQHYPAVKTGQTRVRIQVYGIDVGERTVTRKSPTIDPSLRTFQIKCLISAPPKGITPGAIAEMTVLLDQRDALGIPADAVQQRGGRDVVFTVEDGAVRVIPVVTGLHNDGYLEISGESLEADMPVITMGQYQVEDNSPVTVQEDSA